MKKTIKSPNSIKTSYITAVKEDLGLPVKKRTKFRKVKPPKHLEPFIKRAIKENPNATYKEIQQITFQLIKNSKSLPFYGIFKQFPTRGIELDKEIFYE